MENKFMRVEEVAEVLEVSTSFAYPDYHRQGIGSALVSAALETLRSVGITKVALVVFERNQGGNAFWEKQGFTVRNDLTYRNKALVEMVRKDT